MTDEDSAWEKTTIERAFARAVALAKENASLRAEQDHYLRQWAAIVEASGIDPFSLRDDGDSSEITAALCRMLRSRRELEAELAAMRAHSLGCTCGNCPKPTPPVVTLPVVPETCGQCAHCVRNLYSPSATLGCSYNKPWTVVDATVAPPSWCPKRQKSAPEGPAECGAPGPRTWTRCELDAGHTGHHSAPGYQWANYGQKP